MSLCKERGVGESFLLEEGGKASGGVGGGGTLGAADFLEGEEVELLGGDGVGDGLEAFFGLFDEAVQVERCHTKASAWLDHSDHADVFGREAVLTAKASVIGAISVEPRAIFESEAESVAIVSRLGDGEGGLVFVVVVVESCAFVEGGLGGPPPCRGLVAWIRIQGAVSDLDVGAGERLAFLLVGVALGVKLAVDRAAGLLCIGGDDGGPLETGPLDTLGSGGLIGHLVRGLLCGRGLGDDLSDVFRGDLVRGFVGFGGGVLGGFGSAFGWKRIRRGFCRQSLEGVVGRVLGGSGFCGGIRGGFVGGFDEGFLGGESVTGDKRHPKEQKQRHKAEHKRRVERSYHRGVKSSERRRVLPEPWP